MLPAKLTVIAFLATVWCCASHTESFFSVACPGENNILECPDNHFIIIEKMEYGKASTINCGDTTQPTTVRGDICIHPLMRGWIRFICDGLQRCRLPKPDPQMFVCDKSDNFVQIKYKCFDYPSDVKEVIACENETAHLKCENSKSIRIIMAKYGRFDEQICSKVPTMMTFCSSPRALSLVKHECGTKNQCTLTADNSLGVPYHCDDIPNYLIVQYECL